MAQHSQWFEFSTGQVVNLDQVRYFEVAGSDLDLFFNPGTAATDKLTIAGAAGEFATLTDFVQNTYDRDIFIRENMLEIISAIFGNEDTLSAFTHRRVHGDGGPQVVQAENMAFLVAEALADKWESENP